MCQPSSHVALVYQWICFCTKANKLLYGWVAEEKLDGLEGVFSHLKQKYIVLFQSKRKTRRPGCNNTYSTFFRARLLLQLLSGFLNIQYVPKFLLKSHLGLNYVCSKSGPTSGLSTNLTEIVSENVQKTRPRQVVPAATSIPAVPSLFPR